MDRHLLSSGTPFPMRLLRRSLRKEAETISVPSWPKIDQLDMWKGKLLSNVLAGRGDPDGGVWSAWLAEAFI